MYDSIQLQTTATGVDFFYFNGVTGQVWNATLPAFEDWVDGHYTQYRLAATQAGTTKLWRRARPTQVNAPAIVQMKQRVAGTIAGDPFLGAASITQEAIGDGDIEVNEDTGGEDNLQVVLPNTTTGIEGVTLRAYLQTEYDDHNYYVRGRSITGADGRWLNAMNLYAGTYVIVAILGNRQQVTRDVEVA